MILLQLSAGQGPLECCLAVGLAGKQVEKACGANQVCCQIVESVSAGQPNCFHSVLLQLEGVNSQELAREWQGVMQWIEPSPFRPQHKRKNWFFSGQVYVCDELEWDTDIRYQTCRASGAGGQHVNTTDSAVRATHTVSGMSVRVESERSQHANKRLARMLLFQKIHALHAQRQKQQDKQRWQQHGDLERGNAVKVFVGKRFLLK